MFQIFADGATIYDSRYDKYSISQGSINLEVNKSGSLVFGLYADHPYYDRIKKLSTIIPVYRDNKLIYRGRVIKTVDGFYGDKVFTCEGELSFLLDSIQRPWSFTGTPEELFTRFITIHNSQVAADKQFTVGRVTVTDPNGYINRANSAYEDTLSNLNSKLLEPLGGYIDITSGENGERVINWLADYPYLSTQTIQFGENLLDFAKTNYAEDIATALIPLGAKIETQDSDVESRVTIESVNGGLDYIYDQEAVNKYGWIYKSVIWDDVTVPANLLTKARAYLNESINLNISLELSALDLSAMNQDISAFMLGDYIQVISKPHGIDAKYLLTKQSIDILYPENDRVTLGYTFSTFTDQTLFNSSTGANLSQKVEKIESNYVSNTKLTDSLQQNLDYIREDILPEYVTATQLSQSLTDLYTQVSSDITASRKGEWLSLTLDPNFGPYQSITLNNPQYKVIGDIISLKGIVAPVTDITLSGIPVVIASGIPETVRPAYDISVICASESGPWECTIQSNGSVALTSINGNVTVLAGTRLTILVTYEI